MGDLDGQGAIVTGAGQGLGAAIAEALATQGADVVVTDVQADRAEDVVARIRAAGGRARASACDVTDEAAVAGLVDAVADGDPPLRVLVNNAGIVRAGMLHKLSTEDWDAVLRVNLTSQFLTMRAVAPHLIAAGTGSIVNISSAVAVHGAVGQVNYVAAKAGVVGLTKGAALELARHGVRVNAIAPGTIETDMTRTILETPKFRAQYVDTIPLGRVGTPADVADAVTYLVSPRSAYVTGHVLFVDGGAFT